MKVVLAVKYLHQKYGGAERMVSHTANVLAEAGHAVAISVFEPNGPDILFELHNDIEILNSELAGIPISSKVARAAEETEAELRRHHRLEQPLNEWLEKNRRYSLRWASSILATAPDVVIAFLPHTYIPLLYALAPHVPLVVSFQNAPGREIEGFCGGKRDEQKAELFHHLLARARSTVVLLPEFKPILSQLFSGPVHVRPNFVDLQAPPRYPSPRPRIIAAGRLAPVKGFGVAVEAMAYVTKAFPTALLSIFGDGEEEANLRRIIREGWLQHNVVLGGVTNELPAMMAQNLICLMPSLVEGFGLVALEAMAVGLPVVAFSDCDALRYLLQESGGGLLVEDRSPEALGAAIVSLLNDEKLRCEMSDRALAFAASFTREGYKKGFEEIVMNARGDR